MKRMILCLLTVCLLTGCWMPYDLSNFITPDDKEFIEVMEALDTPKKICAYMKKNYEWELHIPSYSPYQMWLANIQVKAGDCNDMSCYAVYIANSHGYETYQIAISFENSMYGHMLGVFVEDGEYTYSDNYNYRPVYANHFREIVKHYFTYQVMEFKSYKVYNYNNQIVERGYKTK